MNSDAVLIVETKDFQYIDNQKSEFYTENNIKFGSSLKVLKNSYNQNFINSVTRIETNNNDFFQNMNGESCAGVDNFIERDKKYYHLFFLKKRGTQYFAIAHLWNNILTEDLPFFEKNIAQINSISKERNLKNKYQEIKKWFQTSNENHPDQYIIYSPFTEELVTFFEKNN